MVYNAPNMKFDSKIHHRRSIRLKEYDYSQEGYYYITICTKNKIEYFGKIVNGKMELSKIGGIVCDEWIKTKQIRKNVKLDAWVVMPNHFHGIVIIDDEIVISHVGTCRGMPLQQFAKPISNSLPMIVNHFKSAVKRWCNKNGHEYFQWQRNYYEHVIHNEIALYKIRRYIINNPMQWHIDRNNSDKHPRNNFPVQNSL